MKGKEMLQIQYKCGHQIMQQQIIETRGFLIKKEDFEKNQNLEALIINSQDENTFKCDGCGGDSVQVNTKFAK